MYRRNLREIVERLKETGKRIVWGSTTPVICERHAAVKSFDRLESDVVAYNAAAAEIVAAHGIAINDLYGVVMAGGVDEYLSRDGVHMTDKGYAMLGEAVAAAVRKNFEGCSCSDAQPFY
jgi:acyl-CoA thioesterase-1